jgi:hypothetical protein
MFFKSPLGVDFYRSFKFRVLGRLNVTVKFNFVKRNYSGFGTSNEKHKIRTLFGFTS